MERIRAWRWIGALLLCNVLAACGGGGGGEPSGGVPAPGTTVSLSARGTSAATATLTWQGHEADASARYRIERRKGSTGAFETVAEVAAGDGLYLDRGLAASSSYAYRLVRVDAGGSVLAQGDAHTSDVQPVVTAAGEPIGEAASVSVSQQATVLSAGDGSLTVELPADAQRAAGTATVQRLTNPLPEGRGEALRIELPSRPNGALVVKMKIPATEDAEAAAQRLAVRTEDGSWLLLPAAALDTQARLVTTTVPAAAFSAAASASRAQASAVATAASAGFRLDLLRLVALGLRPAEASVRVVGTLRFMPYAVYQVLLPEADPGCEDAIDLCVPMPVLAKQALPILNNKPLYERVWKVDDVAGGDSIHGTMTLLDPAGAVYTAPSTRPNPSTVTVSFTSRHLGSDRTLKLRAKVHVEEDAWVGPMIFVIEATGQPVGFYYAADTHWVLDPATSTPQRRVYRAQGTIDVEAHAGSCTITIDPGRQSLGPDLGLSELIVDESVQPATYRLQLYTNWDTTWHYGCAPGVTSKSAMGALWNVSGTVDGGRITGSEQDPPARKSWQLSRSQ